MTEDEKNSWNLVGSREAHKENEKAGKKKEKRQKKEKVFKSSGVDRHREI